MEVLTLDNVKINPIKTIFSCSELMTKYELDDFHIIIFEKS